MPTVYDFSATRIEGTEQSLDEFRDQVILIVNTASQCTYTPQYTGLQKLYKTYRKQGFTVLGFPCDQFAHEEPGDENEIANFCSTIYHVTFPMFAKIEVNGSRTHPLYNWLKREQGGLLGGRIKWNFTKFLIGRDGKVIGRYAPANTPEKLTDKITAALAIQPAPRD
ncbi:glutathione peroxidase [Kribbella sp. NBC_01245]|uniref:glutathione peroxidase n=1 Tax=Kribbella sp. NBC_01245 TaxID=2903578 RepID=UPI002E2D7959|nr:glutathione peroxidase [Kribbella sp. NBC_01245]